MAYEFKRAARVSGDPEIIGNELRKLMDAHGGSVTPTDIVAAARKKGSPLHEFFEWDDTVAAEQYRLVQARFLLRIIVNIDDSENRPMVRAFVHVDPNLQSSRYMQIESALEHADTRAQILERAKDEIRRWRIRYAHLAEFAELIQVIDDAVAA